MFLDALVVRCVLLPAVLELLGPLTWRLPPGIERRLPRVNIEGDSAETEGLAEQLSGDSGDPVTTATAAGSDRGA